MAIYELNGQAPEFPVDGLYWVAESAIVVGKVRLKSEASIWYGSVLRGDNEWIELGERSQIQDNCTLHTDPGFPLSIGKASVIGHNVVLHGCTIGDQSLIGMGAIVLNGATVAPEAIVAAGSLVPEGATIPSRTLAMGSPAKVRRDLTDAEVASILAYASRYVSYRLDYMKETP